ncbi:MAG: hypothetical protein EKK57_09650 [Proteobacteria bacterium]|nr:MAG: hypothetical protein EKK57_09650 [Pseudomonadota bacterium]
MANCCSNSFYSETLNAPDCSIDCLSAANPGAIFVGASGEIYILTGDDPCVLADWKSQAECCLSFTNETDSITVCCNEELTLTSSDGSIDITIDELTGIDFKSNLSITFTDDYGNDFDVVSGTSVTLSDNAGITVEIVADGQYRISGNSYFGAGVPGVTPTHQTLANYYFDTTNNVVYVWKPGVNTWVRINYFPSPVALFSYITSGLTATFDGTGSTSTQVGTSLTYQWTGSGPAAVTFGTPTAASTTATFTLPGNYIITLTVTDSNSVAKAYTQTVKIEPKTECDVRFAIPDVAFADPSTPLDSEVNTWITANGPFNNRTILYNIGSGSATSPEFIWIYTC